MNLLSKSIIILVIFLNITFAREFVPLPNEKIVFNKQLPILPFEDDYGKKRSISEFLGKPIIILPIYTHCHSSCSENVTQLKQALFKSNFNFQEIQIFLFTFDSNETIYDLQNFRGTHRLPAAWTLARFNKNSIQTIIDTLDYRLARQNNEWVHPNIIAFFSSQLKLKRLLYGNRFNSTQLKEHIDSINKDNYWKIILGPYIFAISVMGLIFSSILIVFAVSRQNPEHFPIIKDPNSSY